MPNWIHNEITVSGPEDELKAFCEKAKGTLEIDGKSIDVALSFESLLPIPAGLSDSYNWRIEKWGSKSGIILYETNDPDSSYQTYVSEESVVYFGESAWDPPIEAIRAISAQHPALFFGLFYDDGADWCYEDEEDVDGDMDSDAEEVSGKTAASEEYVEALCGYEYFQAGESVPCVDL